MNTEELHQFAELWTQLQTRRLEDLEWRTTSLGVLRLPDCTRQSQHTNTLFIGSFADHDWPRIWKLKEEPKCHLFTCLLLQWRLPTADRIIRQGGQWNPICWLCYCSVFSLEFMERKMPTSLWKQGERRTKAARGHSRRLCNAQTR